MINYFAMREILREILCWGRVMASPIYSTKTYLLWPTFVHGLCCFIYCLQPKPEAQEPSGKGRFASFNALVVEFFVAAYSQQSHKHVWGNVLIWTTGPPTCTFLKPLLVNCQSQMRPIPVKIFEVYNSRWIEHSLI